jgi:hypothetical protein
VSWPSISPVLKILCCWALVAHACNPSYSGGRDQEDCSLKPAWTKFENPYLEKKASQKNGWWSGSRCRPWVQTLVPQKKNKTFFLGGGLFCFMVLGFELWASCLQACPLPLKPCPESTLLWLLWRWMGSHELFTQAGLKPQSSQFQPPKLLGLQVCPVLTFSFMVLQF